MKAPARLHARKECGYPLPYEQLKTGIKRQIALGKRCQSVDPMSCFKWIVIVHFLSRQFMHAFKYHPS